MKSSVRLAASSALLAAGLGLVVGTATQALAQVAPLPLDPCSAGSSCNEPGPAPPPVRAPARSYIDEDLSGRGSDGGGGGG